MELLLQQKVIIFILIVPLSDSLSLAAGAIVSASNFMFSFIPVFTALVSASGRPASSYLYSASMLSFASLCDGFCSKIVLPSVGVITSLNIFSALDSNIRISRVTSTIKKKCPDRSANPQQTCALPSQLVGLIQTDSLRSSKSMWK